MNGAPEADRTSSPLVTHSRANIQLAFAVIYIVWGVTPAVNRIMALALPPLLIAALLLTTMTSAIIVNDGEAIWLEGVALIGLYCIIAAAFWWG